MISFYTLLIIILVNNEKKNSLSPYFIRQNVTPYVHSVQTSLV